MSQAEVGHGPEGHEETFVIDNVDALKAVAEPQRLRVLLELGEGPRTVKDLGAVIGVPPTRLYYHIKILEKHGFIRVTRRRMVSGIEERTYEAVARNWTISDDLWTSVPATGVLKTMFDLVRTELEIAIARDHARVVAEHLAPTIAYTHLYLSDDDALELQRRLAAIMDDFGPHSDIEGKPEYHALLISYKVGDDAQG